ncbi:uncharacterized protein LOC125546636 [Triticum urartu]|uniref:uncharacterized protein LOC125546632 n=1 Tax=Triticum urartu TaxID=4572 RepID=UPI002043D1D5|nr:uncharacterized protein LOC125546632 [Triticum urartu]XP_048566771.1 uncharacterized protein LOC125546636 [Triticum urartu]
MWLLIKIIYHMITFKGAIAKLEEAAARAHGRPARLDWLRSACRHLRGVDSHLTRMHDFLESDLPGDDRLGVWSRRGAGKTSLLRPLRQPSPYHALFDRVLYLEVGSRWSVTDVQLGICCTCLGCSYDVMSSADDRSRACLIRGVDNQDALHHWSYLVRALGHNDHVLQEDLWDAWSSRRQLVEFGGERRGRGGGRDEERVEGRAVADALAVVLVEERPERAAPAHVARPALPLHSLRRAHGPPLVPILVGWFGR